jgi:Resolvase, N terminal domain
VWIDYYIFSKTWRKFHDVIFVDLLPNYYSCYQKMRLHHLAASGTAGPGLAKALDHFRASDALVIWKLERIGRSLGHVVELVAGL